MPPNNLCGVTRPTTNSRVEKGFLTFGSTFSISHPLDWPDLKHPVSYVTEAHRANFGRFCADELQYYILRVKNVRWGNQGVREREKGQKREFKWDWEGARNTVERGGRNWIRQSNGKRWRTLFSSCSQLQTFFSVQRLNFLVEEGKFLSRKNCGEGEALEKASSRSKIQCYLRNVVFRSLLCYQTSTSSMSPTDRRKRNVGIFNGTFFSRLRGLQDPSIVQHPLWHIGAFELHNFTNLRNLPPKM